VLRIDMDLIWPFAPFHQLRREAMSERMATSVCARNTQLEKQLAPPRVVLFVPFKSGLPTIQNCPRAPFRAAQPPRSRIRDFQHIKRFSRFVESMSHVFSINL